MKKLIIILGLCLLSLSSLANPLRNADVFQLKAKVVDPNTVLLHWKIEKGYFLYKNKIHINASTHTSIGPLRLPKPLIKKDIYAEYSVYRKELRLPLALLNDQAGETTLSINYQGCADSGFCYPPTQQALTLLIDKNHAITGIKSLSPQIKKAAAKQAKAPSTNDKLQALFAEHHFWFVVFSFFGFGLLLSFTPCVLPMVPVLSGIIVGQHKDITTKKAFLLSLAYVLSMAFTYALVGVIIAALGKNLQVVFQAPWVLALFSLIFIALALSMFGFFELRLPLSLQAKLANISKNQHSGAYIGAAIMGSLSTLILSPCVTAPLVGALGYIANSGDMYLGGMALLFLGLGMGAPLLLIGTGAGKYLPKAGAWMNAVKSFFGLLLLAVALLIGQRILPPFITMLLWASLLIVPAVYLGAFKKSTKTPVKILTKGLGLGLFIYGVLILTGAAMGNRDPLQPLKLNSQSHQSLASRPMTIVTNLTSTQAYLAKSKGKIVMLDFFADWCISCTAMEAHVFTQAKLVKALKDVVWIKADVTANSQETNQLQHHFKVIAPPTFIFFGPDGHEKARIVGEANVEEIIYALNK